MASIQPDVSDLPLPATPLPVGVYHVTPAQVGQIALAARFYAAFNGGDVATIMALLSPVAVVSDCDYTTASLVTVSGRSNVEAFFRARFSEHDNWTVEFYQVHPENPRQVVVVPLERASDTLRLLSSTGGPKRSFAVLMSLRFTESLDRIDEVQWGTVMGPTIAKELCTV